MNEHCCIVSKEQQEGELPVPMKEAVYEKKGIAGGYYCGSIVGLVDTHYDESADDSILHA